jgi:hypothetical protein
MWEGRRTIANLDFYRELNEPGTGSGHDSSTGGLLGAFKKYSNL